jgi:hypothetical protein
MRWRFACAAALALTHLSGGRLWAQIPLFVRLSNVQFPPSVRWWTIETPHFQVIYPDSMAAEAQRAASVLERAYEPLGRTLQRAPERIPVVLNNQSAIANAFVAWAPRRSEWYALPPTGVDEFGPVDWFTLLAVHEGRHIVQERAIRDGWIGLLGRVFGDGTTAFVGGSLYFPSWFWEGDAVGTETALTSAGRGRQPSFANRIRTMRLSGEPYSYHQAWNGSYRTYYPDWYQLGYVLTTHVKRVYGADAWRQVIRIASRWPLPPLALSHGLKKVTGKSLTQVHRDAIHELDSLWRLQVSGLDTTSVVPVSPLVEDYHGWRLPQFAGDGSIIVEYSDLSSPPALVRLKDGRREVLVRQFATRGEQLFHVAGDRVVWTEYEVDPRFAQRSYLTLRLLDLKTGRVRRLTRKTRYMAPALSPDARSIAAVRFTESGASYLDVVDAESGAVTMTFPNPAGHFLVTPAWTPDGRGVYVVAVDRREGRGNALVRVDLSTMEGDTVQAFRQDAIIRPTAAGEWVLYGSPASGIDNIEALHLTTWRRFQLTSRRYGARNPSVSADGRRLIFQDYTVLGYDIVESTMDAATWQPLEHVPSRQVSYYAPLLEQEQGSATEGVIPPRNWKVEPYGGPGRSLAFHSLSFAPTGDAHNQGLMLQSRNVLNTFATSIGAIVNTAERTGSLEFGASYGGLYPIFDGALRYGDRASIATVDSGRVRHHWSERSGQLGIRVPLVRLRGLATDRLTMSTSLGITHVEGRTIDSRFSNNNGTFLPLTYAASASRLVGSGSRDVLPRGVAASVLYRHTPFAGDYQGHQLAVQGAAYLPGLVPTHGMVLEAAREEQRRTNYLFSSQYSMPRGYDGFTAERFGRVGATYAFPLAYPDVAIGPLAYVRRVQGNVFYDYGYAARRDNSRRILLRSLGAELTTDVAPIQMRSTLRTGVRVSYRVDERPHARANVLLSLPF